jgi:hypothetical protein
MARFSGKIKVTEEFITLDWDVGKVIFEPQAKQG